MGLRLMIGPWVIEFTSMYLTGGRSSKFGPVLEHVGRNMERLSF